MKEKLAEFFRKAPRTTIKVSEDEYKDFCEILENPPKTPSALILAMERGRKRREAKNL
jgi:uncharacterized protein (DUF1778 family)